MAQPKIKEAYRIFFLVKGHLNCSEETARACYDNYFKRCWYNQESWIREEDFKEAYRKKYETTKF
tara:strand:- start:279 stop:473 length:195 start_codon:yes stop_codon:yes gene_type:complete